MPVVDERLIAKAKALRAQGMTQEEIAVELGVVQSTVSTILRQHGLGGKLVKAQKLRRQESGTILLPLTAHKTNSGEMLLSTMSSRATFNPSL